MPARTLPLLAACLALAALPDHADNPLLPPDQGVCDGHVHLFDGVPYLFTSHDFDPHAKGWDNHDWQLFSSPDLIHWTKKFVLHPGDTYIGPGLTRCFATDGATRDGKYYFYFSDGQANTGVARADSPDGPYVDALGHPMVSSYDPTPFIDDDARHTPYFVWGAVHFQVARLNDDMVSLAEPPRTVELLDWRDVHDGSFLHKHHGTYYFTSQRGYYGTGTSVYGPFEYVGRIAPFGRDDDVDHPTFFSWHGQDYFVGNQPDTSPYHRHLRMTYVHYKDNGELVADPVVYASSTGVGQYDAAEGKIEAEWFFARGGALEKKERPAGGFELVGIRDGDSLSFPNVKNLPLGANVTFRASSPGRAVIEVHENTPTGRLLGTCAVDGTGSFTKYGDFPCRLSNSADTVNLCLVFRGTGDDLLHLDWFGLAK